MAGHVRTTLVPEIMTVSGGIRGAVKLYRLVKPVPSVLMANIVPLPELPKLYVVPYVVPYKVLLDSTKPFGKAPSLKLKLCRTVNPIPLVLRLKTVPAPKLPPFCAVPYRVLPDTTKPDG